MRAAPTAVVAVLAFFLIPAPPAGAALRFKPCRIDAFPCARLGVPLDRSGVTPGRVPLFVTRVESYAGPRRGVVFVLAGGPGQSATDAFASDAVLQLAPAFRRHDLIIFDQRGTGRSGLLRCPAVERSNLFDAGPAAGACARRLGARRHHYTTRDSVEDIEAIRRELRVERITLFGTSYGVRVALGYALTYPDRVKRLVLDSVVEADDVDPLYLKPYGVVSRVLRSLCRSGCGAFTRDPVADLAALVRRLAVRPLRGAVVDPRGRRRQVRLSRGELFLILMSGDFDPALRAAFPGAVRSALDGDQAPLLRLKRRAFSVAAEPPPPRQFSTGLYTATTCEESAFPWPRTTPPDPAERRRLTEAALTAIPSSVFLPFDGATVLESDLLQLCDRWAAAPASPAFGPGPLPDVPVLLLAGEEDMRTPVESARRVAGLFPQANLVVSPDTGHSALGSDPSGCAARAFARFFLGRAVPARCPRRRRSFPVLPPPPRALREVAPAAGTRGVRGRVVAALAATLRDVSQDSVTQLIFAPDDPDLARGGGLRAGRYRLDGRGTLHLSGVVFVPGVRVSGRLRRFEEPRQRGRLVVGGPAAPDGAFRVRGRRIVGRLGGQRMDARLVLRPGRASARALAARLPAPVGYPAHGRPPSLD